MEWNQSVETITEYWKQKKIHDEYKIYGRGLTAGDVGPARTGDRDRLAENNPSSGSFSKALDEDFCGAFFPLDKLLESKKREIRS
jgi:hypothetical protein